MAKILEYISLNYTWFLVAAIIIVLAIIGHYAEKSNFGQGKTDSNTSPEDEDKKLELEKVTLSDLINKEEKNKNINEPENINAQEIFNENSLEDIPDSINELPKSSIESVVQQQDINQTQIDVTNQTNLTDDFNNQFTNSDSVNSDSVDEITEDLFRPIESVSINKVENTSDINDNGNNIEKSDISVTEEPKLIENVNENQNSIDLAETSEDLFADFDKAFDTVVPKKDIINEDILEDIEDLSLEKTQVFNTEDIPDLDDVDLPEIRDTNLSENDIWKF